MNSRRTSTTALLTIALLATALAACRPDEQGRQLEFKPGEYHGEPVTPLTPTQQRELGERTTLQR